ncbi:MAG: response regulator [bacterium]
MKKIKILIADDHPILILGLKSLLSPQSDIDIVGDAADLDILLELTEKHKPDILLLDISFTDKSSLDYIPEIKNKSAETKILILTMHEELLFLQEALDKGACGFLIKRSIYEDLIYAIKSVINGGTYIHPLMAEKLTYNMYNNMDMHNESNEKILWQSLSKREQEVLVGVARGLSNKEIGIKYDLSEKTVATYRLRGLAKLKISNKTNLLDLCLKLGYIK